MLFDSIGDGHHPDYLWYVISCIQDRPEWELVIQTSAGFETYLQKRLKSQALDLSRVRLDYLPEQQVKAWYQSPMILRSFSEWKAVLQGVKKHQVDQVLLMYADYFQLGLRWGASCPVPVAGILFRPPYALNQGGWYEKLKTWVLRQCLKAKGFQPLFILNESLHEGIQALSPHAEVRTLPDPFEPIEVGAQTQEAFQKLYPKTQGKIQLLSFGYLDERKGIQALCQGLAQLSPESQSQIQLLLMGTCTPDFEQQLKQWTALAPRVECLLATTYQSEAMVQCAFQSCDWVWVGYPNFMGSSSVLVRAAAAGKPSLGGPEGEIGYLLAERNLGLSFPSYEAKVIAEALEKILNGQAKVKKEALFAFAKAHSLENFGKALLDAL